MTDFVSMMDEYYALRLARNMTKVGFAPTVACRVHDIKDMHIREAAQCLAIDSTPLLEATLKAQHEWMRKLQNQLPSL